MLTHKYPRRQAATSIALARKDSKVIMETKTSVPRITFFEQYGSLGGGQQILLELVAAARSQGYGVNVLIPQGACADKLRDEHTAVTLIDECPLSQGKKSLWDTCIWLAYNLKIFFKYFKLLKQTDLVYINGARLLLSGALLSFFLRKKTAFHIHLRHGALERSLYRHLLGLSSTVALIVPSAFIQRDYPAKEPRIITVENGLDKRFSGIAYRDRFAGSLLRHVAIVGRISPEKGQDVLLTLAPAFPDMLFHVLGDAAFTEDSYYQTLRRNASPNVVFHGWVEDVAQVVNEQHIQLWIVPSRCEEASSLVCMQGAATSCVMAVRAEGALVDMATELGLSSFHTDKELQEILEQLRQQDAETLAASTLFAYQRVMARYGHDTLQKRLVALLRRLSA